MQALLKVIKWLLVLLTLLLVGYFFGVYLFHEKVFYLNEKYRFYLLIQIVHLATSLSVLFVIWSSQLFDKWKKIDQTLLAVFLSVFGLWYWYKKYSATYIKKANEKEY